MVRSVQSVKSLSFSTPITSALDAAPARIAWSAVASAWLNPEQAVFTSSAAGLPSPSRAATRAAMLGERSIAVQVATTTRSISAVSRPAFAIAFSADRQAISSTCSSGAAIRRSRIPTRLWIHSSFVSTIVASSALVSTRSGW